MEKTTKMLPVVLTKDERIDSAVTLSEKLQELAELDEQRRAEASRFKMLMDALQTEIDVLAGNVKEGTEERPIECELVYNHPRRGLKSLIRLDSLKTVEEWEMTDVDKKRAADQMQTRIPMPEELE